MNPKSPGKNAGAAMPSSSHRVIRPKTPMGLMAAVKSQVITVPSPARSVPIPRIPRSLMSSPIKNQGIAVASPSRRDPKTPMSQHVFEGMSSSSSSTSPS